MLEPASSLLEESFNHLRRIGGDGCGAIHADVGGEQEPGEGDDDEHGNAAQHGVLDPMFSGVSAHFASAVFAAFECSRYDDFLAYSNGDYAHG